MADSTTAIQKKPESPENRKIIEILKPPLVLMVICLISSVLLVGAYHLTYVDNTGVITDKLQSACVEVMGEGSFEMLQDFDPQSDRINSVIVDKNRGLCAIEVTMDGYSKNGLHLLVGINEDGAISGISVVSIGETPGLGTKVQNEEFLQKFVGVTQTNPDNIPVDGITGATYSSKGMRRAAAAALELYNQRKGEIFGG